MKFCRFNRFLNSLNQHLNKNYYYFAHWTIAGLAQFLQNIENKNIFVYLCYRAAFPIPGIPVKFELISYSACGQHLSSDTHELEFCSNGVQCVGG